MICASPVQRVENERLRDENKALEAENEKLRELAVLMYETIKDLQDAFDVCIIVGEVALTAEYFKEEYLNELGIEVDV